MTDDQVEKLRAMLPGVEVTMLRLDPALIADHVLTLEEAAEWMTQADVIRAEKMGYACTLPVPLESYYPDARQRARNAPICRPSQTEGTHLDAARKTGPIRGTDALSST